MSAKPELDTIIARIQEVYLSDDSPWIVGYSGGKDSTATLQLIWQALSTLPPEHLQKTVYVISTDTLVDSPVISAWVKSSLEKLEYYAAKRNLPFSVHRLKPDIKETFWVCLIGRGYAYPRSKFRWCTQRLKINPSNQFITSLMKQHKILGEMIMVLGTRKSESVSRGKNMERYEAKRYREHLSPNGAYGSGYVFTPIENWSSNDVWDFLLTHKNPWAQDNQLLYELYAGITSDSESNILPGSDTSQTSRKSRFGCWVCTMVREDKSMKALIEKSTENAWLQPLLEFRNELYDISKDRSRRDFRKSQGNLLLFRNRLVHGPYKKAVCEEFLLKLLKLQKLIQQTAPPAYQPIELISVAELREIRRIWLDEKHWFDDKLPSIYYEVTGQLFKDDTVKKNQHFSQQEWCDLNDICKELYPDEELLPELCTSALDIAARKEAFGRQSSRKSDYEKLLSKCMYKNEKDALQYAAKRKDFEEQNLNQEGDSKE